MSNQERRDSFQFARYINHAMRRLSDWSKSDFPTDPAITEDSIEISDIVYGGPSVWENIFDEESRQNFIREIISQTGVMYDPETEPDLFGVVDIDELNQSDLTYCRITNKDNISFIVEYEQVENSEKCSPLNYYFSRYFHPATR